MQPLTTDEIQRALDEAAHSGNYFLLNAIKRMAGELRELRDQQAMARFCHEIEPSL